MVEQRKEGERISILVEPIVRGRCHEGEGKDQVELHKALRKKAHLRLGVLAEDHRDHQEEGIDHRSCTEREIGIFGEANEIDRNAWEENGTEVGTQREEIALEKVVGKVVVCLLVEVRRVRIDCKKANDVVDGLLQCIEFVSLGKTAH
jgi:hypothetical protein